MSNRGSNPYDQNTASGPRGFVRTYFDLEPLLSDWLKRRAAVLGLSKRAYIRALIIEAKRSDDQHGKKK